MTALTEVASGYILCEGLAVVFYRGTLKMALKPTPDGALGAKRGRSRDYSVVGFTTGFIPSQAFSLYGGVYCRYDVSLEPPPSPLET